LEGKGDLFVVERSALVVDFGGTRYPIDGGLDFVRSLLVKLMNDFGIVEK